MDKMYKISLKLCGHEMYRVCRKLTDAYETATNLWMDELLPMLHKGGFLFRFYGETHIKDDLMEALVKLKNGEIESASYNGIIIEVCDGL